MTSLAPSHPAELRVLGEPQLLVAGEAHLLRRHKALALLAYLASRAPEPARREDLAALFWPGVARARAQQSLRQALSEIRRAVGDTLRTSGAAAAVVPGGIALDVTAFEANVAQGRLEDAVALRRGEFLQGVSAPPGSPLAHWIAAERARQATLFDRAIDGLVQQSRARGDGASAVRWRQRAGTPTPPARSGEYRVRRAVPPSVPATSSPPSAPTTRPTLPFAGGDPRDLLAAAWRRAARGDSTIIVVEGAPGTGKSHLVGEAVRRARAEGATVLAARAMPELRAADGAVLRQLLRHAAEAPGFARAAACARASLGGLVPALTPAPGEMVPDHRTEALPIAVARVLDALADAQPLLLAVDDVESSDAVSQELLAGLIRRLPSRTLVVLTSVPGGVERTRFAQELRHSGETRRVAPAPLTAADALRLVQATLVLPEAAARLVAERLFEWCGEQPVLLREAALLLRDEGVLQQRDDGGLDLQLDRMPEQRWVPSNLAGCVARRRAALEPRLREALDAAAVIGPEVPLGVLEAVLDADADAPVTLELTWRGWLVESILAPGTLGFASELVRQALYRDVPLARRRTLHREAARAAHRAGGAEPEMLARASQHARLGARWSGRTLARLAQVFPLTLSLGSGLTRL